MRGQFMRRFAATSFAPILGAAIVAAASHALGDERSAFTPPSNEAFSATREFFDYEKGVPLEVNITERRNIDGAVREKIVFSGVDGSRVPGYFAIPQEGEGPFPCVILMHGLGGSKSDWWDEESFHRGGLLTKALLGNGIAVLTLDCEHHGERGASNDFESPDVFVFQRGWLYRARDMIVKSAVEHRRAMDYLESRPEIAADRIGVLGYSMGGMMTFQLAAIDDRVSVCVSSVSPILKDGPMSLRVQNFAPFIDDIPVLMMIGDEDRRNYSPQDAQALLDLIPAPDRSLIRYESGHRLPVEWITESSNWLAARLRD